MRAPQRASGIQYGPRLIDSAPPATATSASPVAIVCAAETIACTPVPHRRLTVNAGTSLGMPAFIATTRAMYMSSGAEWITLPNTTWSTCSGSIAARSSAASHRRGAQVGGRHVLQASSVATDGGARRGCDHDLVQSFLLRVGPRRGRLPGCSDRRLARNRRDTAGPTSIFRAAMRPPSRRDRFAVRAARLRGRVAGGRGRPAASPDRSTATARRAAICSDGDLAPPRRSRRRGVAQKLQRQESLAGLAAHDRPERVERRRLLERELHRDRPLVPQGLPAAARVRAVEVGAALRVGQLPRAGVAQRQAARHSRRRLPAVRDAREERAAAGASTAWSCASTAAARSSTSRRCRSAHRAPSRAGGGTTTASCARSTCAASTTFDFADGVLPARACAAARCAARDRRRASSVRNVNRARRDGRGHGQLRRPAPALPRAPGAGPRRAPLPGARADPQPAAVEPGAARLSTRAACSCARRAGASSRSTRSTPASAPAGQPPRAHPAELPRREPARREHARGLAQPRRRADARPDAARTSATCATCGATITRSHYPLHPYTLELADRYGILVWSEIPVFRMASRLFAISEVRAQGAAHAAPRDRARRRTTRR